MKKIVIPILIFLLTLNSCEKDEETPILAGDVNLEMFHFEFNPALQIQFQTDSLLGYKYGTDSIDIDLDGNYDIQISQRICLGCDYSDIDDDNFPYIGLVLKNDFDIAYKKVAVYTGLGTTSSIDLADALPYESRIDKIDSWENSNKSDYFGYENGQIWFWGDPPFPFWSYGPWYKLTNSEMYLGIRKRTSNDYKLGWIKLIVYSKDDFEIISYAIEK